MGWLCLFFIFGTKENGENKFCRLGGRFEVVHGKLREREESAAEKEKCCFFSPQQQYSFSPSPGIRVKGSAHFFF